MPDLPWFVYLMLLAPLGLLLVAAVYKTLQVRAAREWPSAAGKVVASHAEVREIRVIDSNRESGYRTEQRNFANIVYEYAVAGKTLRNNRVSIGEDLGNFEVAETIAKYPVGAVVTVYYNPLHPKEAVLERDLPKGLWGCLGIGTAITLVDRVRLGDRAQQTERIHLHGAASSDGVAIGHCLRRVRRRHRAVRARDAPAGVARQKMAGRGRHHQTVRSRTIPRRANRRRTARATSCISARCSTRTPTTTSPTPARTPPSPATSRRARTG